MKNQFDELTKALAESVTRRAALKKFGIGLAGMALTCLGLANKAEAGPIPCQSDVDCKRLGKNYVCCTFRNGKVCTLRPFCGGGFP